MGEAAILGVVNATVYTSPLLTLEKFGLLSSIGLNCNHPPKLFGFLSFYLVMRMNSLDR